jgi:hypothetical protein
MPFCSFLDLHFNFFKISHSHESVKIAKNRIEDQSLSLQDAYFCIFP